MDKVKYKFADWHTRVPYTYINGLVVWYVWDDKRKAWVLPK